MLGGVVRIADSSNFNVSTTIAAALVTVRPGGMHEMHWHPNADEWRYYLKGNARMTVFNTGPNAMTMDFNPGDIGYVKRNLGHHAENVGDTDMQFIGVFRVSRHEEISLSKIARGAETAVSSRIADEEEINALAPTRPPCCGMRIAPASARLSSRGMICCRSNQRHQQMVGDNSDDEDYAVVPRACVLIGS
jgi:oxalate decarboxylase family bicupin protein